MKVDILSDLHLDFYFKQNFTTSENITSFFKQIFTDNDTREFGSFLIIAGDIGHGMRTQKYMSITKTTRLTASRDLSNLLKKGVMLSHGKGRGVYYTLVL